jgi:hypothetical protein
MERTDKLTILLDHAKPQEIMTALRKANEGHTLQSLRDPPQDTAQREVINTLSAPLPKPERLAPAERSLKSVGSAAPAGAARWIAPAIAAVVAAFAFAGVIWWLGSRSPVNVSWFDTIKFMNALTDRENTDDQRATSEHAVMMRKHGHGTAPAPAIGCRQRQSGNTRRGQVRQRPIASEATSRIFARMGTEPITGMRIWHLSGASRPTSGVCRICMATCGSGYGIGMAHIRRVRQRDTWARAAVKHA